MRNLALGGIEDAEFLQKVGVLPLIKNLIAFSDRLKGR